MSSLLTDTRGRLWVGTYGGGIDILDILRSGRIASELTLKQHDGLTNLNINKMLADHQGNIWAATDDGFASITSSTLRIRSFHSPDGVEFPTTYLGSGAILPNGDLLFGSIGGLTVIRPSLLDDRSSLPPVVVTAVRVGGGNLVNVGLGRSTFAPIVIRPEANSLSVEFSALDFEAPELNRYQYRLEGFD